MNGAPVRPYVYRGSGQPDQPLETSKCGTLAGYQEHVKNRDPRCEPCWRARREHVREWRIRTGRQRTVKVSVTPAQVEFLRQAR